MYANGKADYDSFGSVIGHALSAGFPVVFTVCRSGQSEIAENSGLREAAPVSDDEAMTFAIRHSLSYSRDKHRLTARVPHARPRATAQK